MAYQTGTATGPDDVLDKLRAFAAANGWTVDRNVAAGSGLEVSVHKGSSYFHLRSYENESIVINGANASSPSTRYGIAVSGSDSYSAGAAWDQQPGYPLRKTVDLGQQAHANLPMPIYFGPFPSYHLIATTNCIYLELEVTAGVFQRLGFGALDLFNPAAAGGGRFFYATGGRHPEATVVSNTSWLGTEVDNATYALELVPFRAADYTQQTGNPGSFLRAAFDSFDGWCGSARTIANSHMSQVCQGGGCHDKMVRDLAPSPRNGVGVIVPNVVSVNRGDTFLAPVGVMPDLRLMDMSLYQPQDTFTLGSDTWKVFPWYQKGGLSFNRGIAYKVA